MRIDGYGEGWKTVETSGNLVETEIRTERYLLLTHYFGDTLTNQSEMVDGSYQGLYVSTTDIDRITTRVWNGQELERGHYSQGNLDGTLEGP